MTDRDAIDAATTIPILASLVAESKNPPGSRVAQCPDCREFLAVDGRSSDLLDRDERYQAWCWRCAARHWPDMEILGTSGVWSWVEHVGGVDVGQIHVGRLTLRGWLHGAKKEM